ncbi:MAG TPA: arylsulfatase [Opitutaceae bacterium]|nr:arylsulfatase [Opitutaceae bacterium]
MDGHPLLPPLLAGVAAVGCAAPLVRAQTAPAAAPPNIVFVLADDLGYGDLGCYGQQLIATPNLDRLAAQGMRFTQFYAGSPVCAPSRNVLLTGQHTGHTLIRGNAKISLRPEDVTVAEVLKEAGYATGAFGKWGVGEEGSTGTPNKKGFDDFFGYVDQTMAHNYYPTFLVRNESRVPLPNVVPHEGPYGQGVATKKVVYSDDPIVAGMLAFVDRNREHPFFLYFPSTLPHANDEAKDEGMEIPSLGRYADQPWPAPEKAKAAMITRLDDDVGRLLAKLDELGLAGNTIFIFASDNGPHAEGGVDPAFFHSSGPLRGIKRDVYEGGIRVPLIVRWPGHVAAGSVSDHVAYFGDFMATAAAIAGVKPPSRLDSTSFLPTLLGRPAEQAQDPYLYWEFYEGRSSQAVRLGDWKGVRIPMLTGEIELYDLRTDIGERHDVAAAHPDVVARIRRVMAEAHVPSPLWRVRGQ